MTKKDVQVLESHRLHENVGEHIGAEMGAKMVKDYYDSFGENQAHFVGRNIIEKILSQPDCTGIKIYKALNAEGEPTYVFVGVDKTGKAILEYAVINGDGTLSKKIGLVVNKFLPPDPGEGWFEYSL